MTMRLLLKTIRIFPILILALSFYNCKSSKHSKARKKPTTEITTRKNKKTGSSKANYIINYAKQFKGVRYKWGGVSTSGMDCSGLIYKSFKSADIFLPRISRDIAKKGYKIQLKKALKGDLLFFKTGNKRNAINHVGLIVEIKNNDIMFIHATSSKGVIISRLNETYWLKAFHEIRRVL